MEEAVTGVKGELAVMVYGTDLKLLEETGDHIVDVMGHITGVADLGLFHVIGQPNLNLTVDRDAAARYGINVADVQDAIETAVGGTVGGSRHAGPRRRGPLRRHGPLLAEVPPDAGRDRQHPPARPPWRTRLARSGPPT